MTAGHADKELCDLPSILQENPDRISSKFYLLRLLSIFVHYANHRYLKILCHTILWQPRFIVHQK